MNSSSALEGYDLGHEFITAYEVPSFVGGHQGQSPNEKKSKE
jgi:hypothetical protein